MRTSILLAVLLLAITASAEEQAGYVELQMWNLSENPSSNPPEDAELRMLQSFERANPNIKMIRAGGAKLTAHHRGTREFLMAQAAGIGPDVIGMVDESLQIYISKNFLLPLDPYLEKAGLLEYFKKSPFLRHFQRDGKIFALPSRRIPHSLVLAYRKDLFEQAGLDPERPPETWEEFLEYAEKLTDPSRNIYGFVMPSRVLGPGQMEGGGFVELIMALNGVEVIRKDEDGRWVADFADDERAIKAVELIQQLLGKKIFRAGKEYTGLATTNAGRADDGDVFARGEAAMIIQDMTALCWIRERNLAIRQTGVGLLPLGPSGDGFRPLRPVPAARGFTYFGVNAACEDPERIKAAVKWIEYLSSEESNKILVETYIDWGWQWYVDPRMVAQIPELAGADSRVPPQWARVWKTHTQNSRTLPMYSQHQQLRQEYLSRIVWSLMDDPEQDVRALLQDTQRRLNANLLGITPPEVMTRRRNIALAVVVSISALFLGAIGFALWGLLRKKDPSQQGQGTIFQAGRKRIYLIAIALMLPAVGSVILWMYLPLVRGAMIAFQDYQILGETKWVGLDNFITVLVDDKFWISLLRTVQYGLISMTLGFVAPIFLAFLLFEVPRGKVLFRVLFYLPAMSSGLVIMFLWKQFYEPTPFGFLNIVIAKFGAIFGMDLGPYKWLVSNDLAMISVIMPTIWAAIGPGSIIYLAALHGVPSDLYEAAELDGAGIWSKIWNVSIPFIRPLIFINFLGAFIGTFHTMQSVFVMTQGGPGDATYLTGLYIFFNSFFWLDFGKATAAAWILGSLLIGFTVYQLRVLKTMKFQAGASEGK